MKKILSGILAGVPFFSVVGISSLPLSRRYLQPADERNSKRVC